MADTWKRPITIGVKCDLLEQAKALNLDIVKITERALDRAIAEAVGHRAEDVTPRPLALTVQPGRRTS